MNAPLVERAPPDRLRSKRTASWLLVLALLSCKKAETPTTSSGTAVSAPPASKAGTALPVDAAAPAPDPLKTLCPQIFARIQECSTDKEFLVALTDGSNAKEEAKIKKLVAEIAEWPINYCRNLAANYQFEGLLDHWDQLEDPAILESCGRLGRAVKAAGGLFGGDQAM